ncbi:MAG: MFS transporter [Lachnospiraceae bacterium]|nr:MFS transporter [Lachnospiraceae bacterium]
MNIIFLLVIYLAFVSLGLPDTLLGSAWPVMQGELGVSLDAQGLITVTVSCATIFSCLMTERIVRYLGTARLAALCGFITAASLLGYSLSPSYLWLIVISVPLGLGAGAVDTCLNNYGALYLEAKHVNWMTCCYGLGATIGPLILSFVLADGGSWRRGYLIISLIQICISVLLVITLPVWRGRDYRGKENGVIRRKEKDAAPDSGKDTTQTNSVSEEEKRKPLFLIPGVAFALICFALFFAIQYGTALWTPSYLVGFRSFSPESAAQTISVFYFCVIMGRFVCGFLSKKFSDKALLRLGIGLCIAGTFFLSLPLPSVLYYGAIALAGLGCAPIFPSMIHMTPARFGREHSQRIVGFQMAAAYAGDVLISPFIGVVAERAGLYTIPVFLLALCVLILILSEWVDRI